MPRGGARPGAGRPANGPIASEPHKTRPPLAARHPVHVVARLTAALRTLPKRHLYAALERALTVSLARASFRLVKLAVRSQRIELAVEADDKTALARGMQGFQVSAAKALNRHARRRGTVFPDRYRMRILKTRAAVRQVVGTLVRGTATVLRVLSRLTPRALARELLQGPVMAYPETWLLQRELRSRAPPPRR